MKYIEKRAEYYRSLVGAKRPSRSGRRAIGRITQETARRLCPVGPLLRCTGIARDVRAEDPYAAYDEVPPQVQTSNDGDIASLLTLQAERDSRLLPDGRVRRSRSSRPGPYKVSIPRAVPAGRVHLPCGGPEGRALLLREVRRRQRTGEGEGQDFDPGQHPDCHGDAEGPHSGRRPRGPHRHGPVLRVHGQDLSRLTSTRPRSGR